MAYQPPFTITSDILNLVANISQAIGRLSVEFEQQKLLRLRKVNRMRTVQGSLAIEGNTLSEAHNAIAAYEAIGSWRPSSGEDLLAAHRVLMTGLVAEAGRYRSQGVGVMSGEQTGKALSTIERRIKKLKQHSLLKRVGSKKTGHWQVTE